MKYKLHVYISVSFGILLSNFRFSLHGEADGLMSGLKYLDGFLNDLSQSPKVSTSLLIEDSQNPDFFPNISRNTFFAMPYTVHYVAKAIEAPSYDSEDYAR